jgi:aerobic-type carbon monoxide dehydrogenase small subunit (CoxS/CutS family)
VAATVVLAVNGQQYEAAGVDRGPVDDAAEFLRTQTPVRGPKLGCGEGTSTLYERANEQQVDTHRYEKPETTYQPAAASG